MLMCWLNMINILSFNILGHYDLRFYFYIFSFLFIISHFMFFLEVFMNFLSFSFKCNYLF